MNISNLSIQILILLWFMSYKEIQFLDLTVYVENGFLPLSLQATTSI